jgi:hypothetical protein
MPCKSKGKPKTKNIHVKTFHSLKKAQNFRDKAKYTMFGSHYQKLQKVGKRTWKVYY